MIVMDTLATSEMGALDHVNLPILSYQFERRACAAATLVVLSFLCFVITFFFLW